MSIAAYLQTELVALSNEARRKYPEIKEAAERVIALLRHPGQGPSNLAAVLSQNQDVLKPFLLACDTKNVKLVTISIGCLRELISHKAMPEGSIEVVLKTLNDIMSHGVEIQLKILQTILPLLTNYNVHAESLAEALLLCFRLQDSRVVFVNNTAAATLRQLVIYIFEKVGDEDIAKQKSVSESQAQAKSEPQDQVDSTQENEEQLGPCALDAYLLFQDLCLLTNSEQARFLNLGSISRTFGLELIESVLTNHFHLFKQHKEFASLLRERVCPLIIKNFSDKHDFPQTMRLMRVVYILIKQFHEILAIECEIFLSMLIKLLEPEGNSQWQRVLAMEIFRGICGDNSLMRRIYRSYDQQSTSTDIFGDMIIAIGRLSTEKPLLIGAGSFVQDNSEISKPSHVSERDASENSVGGLSVSTSTMRIQCVDQLDKAEPPHIPETYLYYLSLICINSIADGLASYIFPIVSLSLHDQQRAQEQKEGSDVAESTPRPTLSVFPNTNTLDLSKTKEADDIALVTTMAESAWPGLLAAFSYFLGSNLDEELFHNVMRAYQNFTSVCGVLQLTIPRDAFLTSLCKNCLPVPHGGAPSGNSAVQDTSAPNITDKNMYCLRILLNVAQYLGGTLFDSWYLILETMQQAEHLLGIKLQRGGASGQKKLAGNFGSMTQPSTKSQSPLQNSSGRTNNGAIDYAGLASGSSHQEADVLALLASFKQLFDLSTHLDLPSFRSFSRALCKLGAAGSGLPFNDGKGTTTTPFVKSLRHINKSDDKSFAIEKLRYVCLLNVDRIAAVDDGSTVWDISVGYLIDTANHPTPSARIRMQACDAISDIILAAMAHAEQNSMARQEETQMRVMNNLRELIQNHGNSLVEIQRMGLETLNKLLQTSGQSLSFGWGLIFEMIQGSIGTTSSKAHVEDLLESSPTTASNETGSQATPAGALKPPGLVRIAFPCLQLICTDFLSLLNASNLQLCIDTLAAFGYQTEDLNISLTSVGLLWNISDFIQQSLRDTSSSPEASAGANSGEDESVEADEITLLFPNPELSRKNLSGLWMLLLFKISTLCSDTRPEVRNGAIQTLLRTIHINAASLDMAAWRQCMWKILLPLLDEVKTASCRKVEELPEPVNTGAFVMRNDSPSKQWDETHVLLYNGLAEVFQHFLLQLIRLHDYLEAWIFLMEHLETAALHSSPDVAIAALKGIQSMMRPPAIKDEATGKGPKSLAIGESELRLARLWETAWSIWERIGSAIVGRDPVIGDKREDYKSYGRTVTNNFTQETLTEYINVMHHLYPIIADKFELKDLRAFLDVVHLVLIYDRSPVYRPDVDYLSPLQLSIHDALTMLNLSTIQGGPAVVLEQLTNQFLLAFEAHGSFDPNADSPHPATLKPTYIALCKATMTRIVFLLDKFQQEKGIYADGVYAKVLKSFGIAMRLRYKCPPSFKHVDDIPLWKTATTAFLDSIKYGISTIEAFEKDISDAKFLEIWQELVVVCRGTMAPSLPIPIADMPLKSQALDEAFDLVFLHSMKTKVFARMGYHRVPAEILAELVQTLDLAANLYILSTPASLAPSPPTLPLATNANIKSNLISIMENSQAKSSELKNISSLSASTLNEDAQLDIIQGLGIVLHSTRNTMVPVGRERFAFACLDILFDLSSDVSSDSQDRLGSSRVGGAKDTTDCVRTADSSNGSTSAYGQSHTHSEKELRSRTAFAITPVLVERCRALLNAYSADQALLGKCPFPRLRHQEISLVLQRLNDLRLVPGALASSNTHSQDSTQDMIKHAILQGPSAHLFFLYEPLTDAMFCHDPEVLLLLKACLKTAGRSIGLPLK
ncbi:hypothetical protein BG015_007775 [Linnemannia schmuckeri]|uniref:Protein MON2 homolog n=1 Tax=Linnemannia schmuckeri TaxID=64567 RepID=A0A9P5VEM7_9FUNG|nr:hypothetical protein BG015_007775 [Linnemannia schmuckeri]